MNELAEVIRLPTRHDPLLTKRQLALTLRVSVRTIERYMERGMPVAQTICGERHFRLSAVREWMEGRSAAA